MKYRLYTSITLATTILFLIVVWQYWSDSILLITELQTKFHQLLSKHIGQFNEEPISNGIILIVISLIYGVFHAAGPGHGKAVLVTYLSTQKETLKQGIMISFAAAIFQATVAITIVTLISIILNQTFSQANLVSMRTEQSSYILVILFGAYFVIRSLLKLKKRFLTHAINHTDGNIEKHNHAHNHSHNHVHGEDCCHHTYVPEAKISKWQTLAIIVSMGARPCTGAIMVLIYAKIIGIYWVGVIATFLMGFGTGLTIATLGFLTIFFRDKMSRLVSNASTTHHSDITSVLLSTLGGVLLISLGWSLLQASLSPAAQHPLF